jgi:phospholipid/cholesterol/gamma-HCH transport system substrate-binding protein
MSNRKIPFRYTNEVVGAFVLVALVVFAAAFFQTGRLRAWFEPGANLKVIMPSEGMSGLARGANVIILGTEAGKVEQIVIGEDQQIYAEVNLNRSMTEFVRRDSRAVIRRQFGVAGAAYLEITRGTGEPLDWGFAVINAVTEQAPTESIGEIIAEMRTQALPILADTRKLLVNLNTITAKIAAGEGAIGRLLLEENLALEVESLLGRLNRDMVKLSPILTSLQTVTGSVATISEQIVAQSADLPEVTEDVKQVLASLQLVMQDVSRTTPQLPALLENVNDSLTNLPVLLVETQQVVFELEMLLKQIRSHWLMGGAGDEPRPPGRIAPMEVPR